jgi:hypothetical protein
MNNTRVSTGVRTGTVKKLKKYAKWERWARWEKDVQNDERDDNDDEHYEYEQENEDDNDEILTFLTGNLSESELEGLRSLELCTDEGVQWAVWQLIAVRKAKVLESWNLSAIWMTCLTFVIFVSE